MIPPGERHAAQQLAGFFGRVGATLGFPEQLRGIGAPFGWGHLAHRVACDGALVLSELQDAMQDGTACQQCLAADHREVVPGFVELEVAVPA